jgi:hypothetical protein
MKTQIVRYLFVTIVCVSTMLSAAEVQEIVVGGGRLNPQKLSYNANDVAFGETLGHLIAEGLPLEILYGERADNFEKGFISFKYWDALWKTNDFAKIKRVASMLNDGSAIRKLRITSPTEPAKDIAEWNLKTNSQLTASTMLSAAEVQEIVVGGGRLNPRKLSYSAKDIAFGETLGELIAEGLPLEILYGSRMDDPFEKGFISFKNWDALWKTNDFAKIKRVASTLNDGNTIRKLRITSPTEPAKDIAEWNLKTNSQLTEAY